MYRQLIIQSVEYMNQLMSTIIILYSAYYTVQLLLHIGMQTGIVDCMYAVQFDVLELHKHSVE